MAWCEACLRRLGKVATPGVPSVAGPIQQGASLKGLGGPQVKQDEENILRKDRLLVQRLCRGKRAFTIG